MKTKIIAIIFFIFTFPVFSVAIGNFHGFGNSVRLNFAFNLYNDYNSTDNYVYSQNGTTIVALIPQSSFGTRVITDLEMLQAKNIIDFDKSRFFLVFTNGTKSNIEEKILEAKTGMIGKTFGQINYKIPTSYLVFLRLVFDYDIINSIQMKGNNEVLIRNEGLNENNITKISMEIIG